MARNGEKYSILDSEESLFSQPYSLSENVNKELHNDSKESLRRRLNGKREDEHRFQVARRHEALRGLRLEVGTVCAHGQGRRKGEAAAARGRGRSSIATEGNRR